MATLHINLTNDQANLLNCYIIMTTHDREEHAKNWRQLAEEKNPDGSPIFKNAEGNARYWEDLERRLSEIRKAIDEAEWEWDEGEKPV